VLIGTVITLADPVLAELIGAPFDLAWIDLEHAALTVAAVPALAVALRAAGCRAEVRLPSWRSEALPPVLDAGVDGVVAPCVESAADATAFVRRLRHPPNGERGYGPRRAGGYGRGEPPIPSCTVQIESPAGVDAAEAIAAVDGVDALVAGCADLALVVGVPIALPLIVLTFLGAFFPIVGSLLAGGAAVLAVVWWNSAFETRRPRAGATAQAGGTARPDRSEAIGRGAGRLAGGIARAVRDRSR
jgi:hypothetical protein